MGLLECLFLKVSRAREIVVSLLLVVAEFVGATAWLEDHSGYRANSEEKVKTESADLNNRVLMST
jgi:hypothetical protein